MSWERNVSTWTMAAAKTETRRCHYERWFNEKNKWWGGLSNVNPTEGPTIQIDSTLVDKVIKHMKTAKATGSSGITAEMLKILASVGYGLITCIVNQVVHERVILNNW